MASLNMPEESLGTYFVSQDRNHIHRSLQYQLSADVLEKYRKWFEEKKLRFPKRQFFLSKIDSGECARDQLWVLPHVALAYIYFEDDWRSAEELLAIGKHILLGNEGRYHYNRFNQCLCLEAENFAYDLECMGFVRLANEVYKSGLRCTANRQSTMLSKNTAKELPFLKLREMFIRRINAVHYLFE